MAHTYFPPLMAKSIADAEHSNANLSQTQTVQEDFLRLNKIFDEASQNLKDVAEAIKQSVDLVLEDSQEEGRKLELELDEVLQGLQRETLEMKQSLNVSLQVMERENLNLYQGLYESYGVIPLFKKPIQQELNSRDYVIASLAKKKKRRGLCGKKKSKNNRALDVSTQQPHFHS